MLESEAPDLQRDVILGLSRKRKALSPKYLYDERGSQLFEEICHVKEYYPTRTEMKILRDHACEMAEEIGPGAIIIEPGAGNGEKLQILLEHLSQPAAYVPIEISRTPLILNAERVRAAHPELLIIPICADYTAELQLPSSVPSTVGRRIIFFPGSTIGNFDPPDARDFLEKMGNLVGEDGGLLIGVDLKKDPTVLKHAYDDAAGVTAKFNLNLLMRLNRELSADFQIQNFRHEARYDESKGRIEMHLVSRVSHSVRVHGEVFHFRKGESIHTECSYKYSVPEFTRLAGEAGFELKKNWIDPAELFCVYYFERT